MRIAVDAAALGSGQGGDETMLVGLLTGLAEVAPAGTRLDLVCRAAADLPVVVARHPGTDRWDLSRVGGARYFAVDLPRALRRLPRPDVVLAVNHAPLSAPAPTALMVQDLSFEHHPEHFPWPTRVRLRSVVRRQVRRVDHLVTVSHFSRDDLVRTYGLAPADVSVIPNAIVDPAPFGSAEELEAARELAKLGIDGRFVLYLGNLHPRKNLGRLIDAMARLQRAGGAADVPLVVAGAHWWGEDGATLAARGAGARIHFLGRVDERQREALLRRASVLAYPSLFEGFGLPPLEAMRRGTPVVASNTTAVAETVGEAACTVDPTDVAALARGIEVVLTDPAYADELVRRGLRQAARYTPSATGAAALAALRRTVDVPAPALSRA